MATVTRFEFTDDIDGKALDVEDLNIVAWSWLGVDYEFETSTTNLDRIEHGRIPVATLLAKSRRVGGRKRSPGRGRAAATSGSGASGASGTKAVRAWAKENGYEVNERGRIAAHIVEAFAEH